MRASELKSLIEVTFEPDDNLVLAWESWLTKHGFYSVDDVVGVHTLCLIYLRISKLNQTTSYLNQLKGVYKKCWLLSRRLLSRIIDLAKILTKENVPFFFMGDLALAVHTVGIERFPVVNIEIGTSVKNRSRLLALLTENGLSCSIDHLLSEYCINSCYVTLDNVKLCSIHFIEDPVFFNNDIVHAKFIDGLDYEFLNKKFALNDLLTSGFNLAYKFPLRSSYLYYFHDLQHDALHKLALLNMVLFRTNALYQRVSFTRNFMSNCFYVAALFFSTQIRSFFLKLHYLFLLIEFRPYVYVFVLSKKILYFILIKIFYMPNGMLRYINKIRNC